MTNQTKDIYYEMLNFLEPISGFVEYKQELEARIKSETSWKPEVKALFELSKMGLLKEIPQRDVDGVSKPDGLINIGMKNGILECRQVNCLFDKNKDDKKEINKKIRNIKEKEKKDFIVSDRGRQFSIDKQSGGVLTVGYNYDINKTIVDCYKEKRKQHKESFPDNSFFKLYYFEISPPSSFDKIDICLINKNINDNELIILELSYVGQGGKFYDKKILIQKKIDHDFTFNNEYFISAGKQIFKNCICK